MTTDGAPWRSGAAEFDDTGFSLVKRDIEVIMLSLQRLTQSLQNLGVDAATVRALFTQFVDDRIPWTVPEGGTGATTLTGYVKGTGTAALTASATIPWADLTGVPVTFPPDAHVHSLGGDLSGTTASGTVDRIKGKNLDASVGSVSGSSQPDLFLWWNKSTQTWATFEWFQGTPVDGDVNVYDSTASDANAKMRTVAAGTACSVFGRSANSAGVPAAITASTNDTVLGRRSGSLTWAKVARSEEADGAACSVIGRSANSSGSVADISAASDGVVLNRKSNSLQWTNAIQVIRSGVTFDLCDVNTFTTSTTPPASSGKKGELYFIY